MGEIALIQTLSDIKKEVKGNLKYQNALDDTISLILKYDNIKKELDKLNGIIIR